MLLVTLNIDISVGTAIKEKGNKLTHDLMCLYSESPDAARAASMLGDNRIDNIIMHSIAIIGTKV